MEKSSRKTMHTITPQLLGTALLGFVLSIGAVTGCRYDGGPNTPHGNHLLFNPDGILHGGHLREPMQCDRTMGDGRIRLTFPNGKKRLAGHCQGGLRVGSWKAWYSNGAPVWKANYKAGRIEGQLTLFHPNGRKLAVHTFSNGALNGKYQAWWSNGRIKTIGAFVANRRNGCWETWHESGKKASKGTYADDSKVLSWIYYTPTGQKRKETLGGEARHGRCRLVF